MLRVVLIALGLFLVFSEGVSSLTIKEELMKKLLNEDDYISLASPPADRITIKFGLSYHCARLCERNRILTSKVTERYCWVDSRLAWNENKTEEGGDEESSDFSKINQLSVPDKYVWTPNIALLNKIQPVVRDTSNVMILPNGTVYWIVETIYKTLFTKDKKIKNNFGSYFKFGPWVSDVNTTLEMFYGGIDTAFYYEECRPYTIEKYRARVKNNVLPEGRNYTTFEIEQTIKKDCSGSYGVDADNYNGCDCGC